MGSSKCLIVVVLACMVTAGFAGAAFGNQVWIKCHISCRCLQDDSVGNFEFVIPVDRTPDTGHSADAACKVVAHKACIAGCNSRKFAFTYKVTSP